MNTILPSIAGRVEAPRASGHGLTRGMRLRRALGGLALAILIFGLGYLLLRPTLLRWGATDAEAAAAMPGDLAGHGWTRAITIEASPDQIWPWLVQWGQGRGGWYSYDWLENLLGFNIHTADRILPEHQTLAVGDPICLADGVCFMSVHLIDPERHLVFQGRDPNDVPFWTFALQLAPIEGGRTRLILRESFAPGALPDAALYALEVADVVMEQKTLATLKILAEGGTPAPYVTVVEITAWLSALVCGLGAGLLTLSQPSWRRPLLVGVAAVVVLLALTFLFPPLWLRAGLAATLVAGLFWSQNPAGVGAALC